jgi:hypothetical protein
MAGAGVHTWQIGELAIARESTAEAQVVASDGASSSAG